MFDIYCPRHRTRVLLGPRRIETLAYTANGLFVQWRCYCGASGTEHIHTRIGDEVDHLDQPMFEPAA
jgi:hypothetical protein